MAKIHHNNYQDTIHDLFSYAKEKDLMFLVEEGKSFEGRHLQINKKFLTNFGTCGYLGLELDPRLIEASQHYTQKFGTQFSVSRAYLNTGINIELESLISQMYAGLPVIVQSSTSACHISAIPSLVAPNDAIILDQSVHMSVQTACQLTGQRGVPIEMIRHNRLDMLERKIAQLDCKYQKIWYMIDGVYSMYGDVAPMRELVMLLKKYPKLHLYIDDAHGMSWCGAQGTGYVFGEVGIHEQMILVTTLAKGFGATGGIIVFPNDETYQKVRFFGGPLTYSHPLPPSVLGAAIASAQIHLSEEIYQMQKELHENIAHCNRYLKSTNLPVISAPNTPIYFIGAGPLKVGHNMVARMMGEGFYINLALFPAVPVKCTGLRFTLTRHQRKEDIQALVNALDYHYPKALQEEEVSRKAIYQAFKIPIKEGEEAASKISISDNNLKIHHASTIYEIDQGDWDKNFSDKGSFNWNGLVFLEKAFQNHAKPEHNWDFHYFIIRDENNEILLATFFTKGLYKDDMLAPASVSRQIELVRKGNPFYFTSSTLAMGSMLTEGEHLFLNCKHSLWKKALLTLLDQLYKLQQRLNVKTILLRDFDTMDTELRNVLLNEGFVKVDMPNANIIQDLSWETREEHLASLSKNSRKNLNREVFSYEHCFEVSVKSKITENEANYFYELYLNVKRKNYSFNLFDYPETIVRKMAQHPGWEFLVLSLTPEFDERKKSLPIAVSWCYKTPTTYCPMILGMDYEYGSKYKTYKQMLYQVVQRARKLKLQKIYLGFSSDTDKKKLGAVQIPKVAYLQALDNFHWEQIENMNISKNN